MRVLALVMPLRSRAKLRRYCCKRVPPGQVNVLEAASKTNYERPKVASLRSPFSHRGTCGSMAFSSIIQAIISAVP